MQAFNESTINGNIAALVVEDVRDALVERILNMVEALCDQYVEYCAKCPDRTPSLKEWWAEVPELEQEFDKLRAFALKRYKEAAACYGQDWQVIQKDNDSYVPLALNTADNYLGNRIRSWNGSVTSPSFSYTVKRKQ